MNPVRRTKTPIVLTPGTPRRVIVEESPQMGFPLSPNRTEALVRSALEEDQAFNDVTTIATVLSTRRARGSLVARTRQGGVIAGIPLAVSAFRVMDPKMTVRVDVPDGMPVRADSCVLFLSGHARAMLSAERTALNFLQRLSGIATLTRKYVDAVAGTGVKILDTRKTAPGWRVLEKYAVRAGGGFNHRMDLGESILIKDNHLVALDGNIAKAVARARKQSDGGKPLRIEVECENTEQVQAALDAGVDVIMLDNMTIRSTSASVKMAKGKAILEASGGVSLDNVRAIAETGVDWISLGAITHSAPALNLSLDFATA
jgi:nicotinate-nucleotide pyrophosphorylase (carboxylating)